MTTRLRPALRLYLVRHGETAWSLSGQHTGHTDLPLTARGEEAARQLGRRLRDVPFSRVWTSPLLRARQTCELAGLKPSAELESALMEWDNGDYEGVTRAGVHQARPRWSLFRDGAPGGETPEQISYRIDGLITRLRLLDGNVAIFSHGHLGRALAARWIGLSVEQGQHLLLGTASLSILCFEHDRTDEPAIELWNSSTPEASLSALAPGDDPRSMRPALERWENEGGEIPTAIAEGRTTLSERVKAT